MKKSLTSSIIIFLCSVSAICFSVASSYRIEESKNVLQLLIAFAVSLIHLFLIYNSKSEFAYFVGFIAVIPTLIVFHSMNIYLFFATLACYIIISWFAPNKYLKFLVILLGIATILFSILSFLIFDVYSQHKTDRNIYYSPNEKYSVITYTDIYDDGNYYTRVACKSNKKMDCIITTFEKDEISILDLDRNVEANIKWISDSNVQINDIKIDVEQKCKQ